jgi:hypothetical protein
MDGAGRLKDPTAAQVAAVDHTAIFGPLPGGDSGPGGSNEGGITGLSDRAANELWGVVPASILLTVN